MAAEFNASDIGAKMGERVDSMRIYVTTVWEGIVQQDHASVQEETDFKDAIKSSGVHAKSLSESERSYQRGETNEKEKVTRRQQVLVILTAFAVIFQTSGLNGAFGVFQAHYTSGESEVMLPREAKNRAAVGAIGSLGGGGLVALFGFMLTPYLNNHVRVILVIGTSLYTLGLSLAAGSTRYWHLFLTQGLIGGIGCGLVQYPLSTLAPEWFSNRSGMAMGIITSAGGLGGLAYSPLIRFLLENVGTRKTLGVICVINVTILAVATSFAQGPRKFAKRNASRLPKQILKDPIFLLVLLVSLLNTLSISAPLAYGPDFSQSLGFSGTMAATLLAIHNGTGSFSRILIGHFGDKMGHMNTLTAGMAITSLAAWTLWLNAAVNQARWAWYVFIAVHGLAGSVFSTLHANVSVQLFGNDVYFAVSGLISCARGVGYAAGSPLAGLIIGEAKTHEKSSKDFKMMIIYISSLLSACTICMITIRAIEASKKGWLWKF